MTEQVAKLMKNLDISEAEALQVIADDKAIDKGAKLFELSAEQKAVAKKSARADRKVVTAPVKRERKSDNAKAEIMALLVSALDGHAEQIELTNPEREAVFTVGGRKFKITLSAPRS